MASRLRRRATALLALWGLAGSPLLAWPVGVAVQVKPHVDAYPVGKKIYPLRKNDPIELGLTVSLRDPDSFLLVGFNLGGCLPVTPQGGRSHQFTGTATLDGRTEVNFGDATDPSASRLWLTLGRIAVKLLPNSGCPPLEMRTPHAVLRPKGTAFRVLVDPVAGTFVAVDEGVVTVESKAGGGPVQVEAGHSVVVPLGGLPASPALSNSSSPGGASTGNEEPPLRLHDLTTEPPEPPP